MSWKTVLAIYLLFWIMSAFLVLPFEARDRGDADAVAVRGQDAGAPKVFRPGRVALRTTVVASLLFALFYANYCYGWATVAMLDFGRR